jgi:isopenicillin-N N-acyltransferase-like protein
MMNPKSYPKMRLLELSGPPFDMGRQHGLAYPEEINALAEDRLQLSSSPAWTGKELSRQEVLDLGEACLPYHEAYAPDLMDELRGISEVTGLGLAELVILNGFTDFIDLVYNADAVSLSTQTASASAPLAAETAAHPALDDCTAFMVHPDSTVEGQGFYGQTWDMHETATPFVILLHGRPEHGLNFLALTIIGCVGMIGMNEAGIAIGINNLMDRQGQVGVTWPFVVRQVLAQDNLADALACITGARLAGAHNYMLMDATGRGYNVEAMATRYHVDEIETGAFVHTNHCLLPQTGQVERPRLPQSRLSSETRLTRGQTLLDAGRVTLADLMALTRDHGASSGICVHPDEPFFVESCAAAIMRPATREMWAVWGNPCVNEYVRYEVEQKPM